MELYFNHVQAIKAGAWFDTDTQESQSGYTYSWDMINFPKLHVYGYSVTIPGSARTQGLENEMSLSFPKDELVKWMEDNNITHIVH